MAREKFIEYGLPFKNRRDTVEHVSIRPVQVPKGIACFATIVIPGDSKMFSHYKLFDQDKKPLGSFVGTINETMIISRLKNI